MAVTAVRYANPPGSPLYFYKSDTTPASPITSQGGTFAPASNKLYLVHVIAEKFTAGAFAGQPSCSGAGMTWHLASGASFSSVDGNGAWYQSAVFYSLSASPSSGTLSVSFSEGIIYALGAIIEIDGQDTTGTDGANGIVQVVGADGTSSAPLVTLASFGSGSNATIGCGFFTGTNAANLTPGSGFSDLATFDGGLVITIADEFKASADTTVDLGSSVSNYWLMIGLEIKSASGGPTDTPRTPTVGAGTLTGTTGIRVYGTVMQPDMA